MIKTSNVAPVTAVSSFLLYSLTACGGFDGEATPVTGWAVEVVATGIDQVDGLALLPDGSILAAQEMNGGGVVRFDPVTQNAEIFAEDLDRPDNVVVLDSGEVFVTEENTDGRLVRIADGRAESFAEGLAKPEGLDVGPFGGLYVAEHDPEGRILRFNLTGQMEVIGSVVNGEGLRVLSDGSILVAETSEDRLLLVGPDGSRKHLFEGQLDEPDGIGHDAERGLVYVTEDAAPGRLFQIDLEVGTLELVAFDLAYPQTMTFEPDGAMLLAEQGTGRILRLRREE